MSQIRPGIPLANHTTAVGIDGSPVILISSMLDDDVTVPREEPAVARMASRHDAIEHIDTKRDRFEEVRRRTHAHQIPGLFVWQMRLNLIDDLVHQGLRLSNSQSADRIARKIHRN